MMENFSGKKLTEDINKFEKTEKGRHSSEKPIIRAFASHRIETPPIIDINFNLPDLRSSCIQFKKCHHISSLFTFFLAVFFKSLIFYNGAFSEN